MSKDSGSLPTGWLWTTVAKVGEIQSGQTPKGIDNHAQPQGAVPWFRIGDMNTPGNERELSQAEINLSHTTAAELGLHIRPKGTIVFPKRGGAIATNKKRRLK
jgi:type I restriction enzyme S subunit